MVVKFELFHVILYEVTHKARFTVFRIKVIVIFQIFFPLQLKIIFSNLTRKCVNDGITNLWGKILVLASMPLGESNELLQSLLDLEQ